MRNMSRTGSRNVYGNRQMNTYIDGNTVRKAVPVYERHFEQTPAPKVHAKNAPIRLGYLLVMITAIAAMCFALIMYVNLQSDLRNRVNNIAAMEKELNNLRLANDETYTKIMSSVDLEEIKYIAITQLGMTYAQEGQIITYTGEGSDYVRQFSDIPD